MSRSYDYHLGFDERAAPSGESTLIDVSVLTPSRQYGRFIGDAILSVRRQAGVTVQHVVQDARSTDETLEVLSRLGGLDWASEPDAGQSDALNKALSRATGRWIAWLNADEFYLPGALAELVSVAERSGADVVYGESVFVDEDGRLERLLSHHGFSGRVLRTYGNFISSCSVVMRRAALGDDPWDVDIRRVMDLDLYLRLLAQGARFLHVRYPVGAFRVHATQVTAAPWQRWQEEDERVAARHGHPTGLPERWRTYTRGRWLHRGRKVLGGSYVREVCVRGFRGRDLRWFDSEVGYANALGLLERCYGRARLDER